MATPASRRTPSSKLLTLFRAIAAGDVDRVSRLLAESPNLATDAAAIGASRGAAKPYYLAAIEHYVYAGDTALHVAAAAHRADIVRDLIARGAAVDARNRRGGEPLHYACDGGPGLKRWNPQAQASAIECLLAAGANPNAVDASGVAPLHRAVRGRCGEAARVLLDHGAKARQTNRSGSTPLHLAVQPTGRGGSGSVEAREQQAEIVRLLLAHGARPTDRGAGGKTVAASASGGWLGELLGG